MSHALPIRRRASAILAGGLTAVVIAGGWAGVARAVSPTVTVTAAPVTKPLPSGFVGLAFTYAALGQWVSPVGPVDPVLVRLIHNLTPTGRPWLRIGGENADRSWWPIAGFHKPIGITYDLGTQWTELARRFARATNAELMLGLNLEADKPQIDKVEARKLLAGVGRHYVQSLQIGNEPELYRSIPWYKVLHGHPVVWYSKAGKPVYARPSSYGPTQFTSEVSRVLKVIPRYAIAGPENNIPSWVQAYMQFLKPHGPVNTVTTHAYGVNNCVKNPRSDVYPTVPNLLSLHGSRNSLHNLEPFISQAHRRGARYRIDEMGAVTCTGPAGVSDSMATALWAVDALFFAAREGVDGVNLHTDYSRINNLFSLHEMGGHWQATVQPLYYGALMFAQASPAGSRQLSVTNGAVGPIRAWATQGRDHKVRIAIIDDGLSAGTTVHLRVPTGYGGRAGMLERLVASGKRGAYSTSGVTLGGRSFRTTTTGALGAPRLTTVKPHGGGYTIGMPKGSAALLTLQRR